MAKGLSPFWKVKRESIAGWCRHRSASLAWVSRVMWACGRASRRRSNAGVVMIASPSQFTPRTRSFSSEGFMPDGSAVGGDAGWRHCRVRLALGPLEFVGLPAVMHPEPVGRILPHRLFKGLVDVTGDGLDTAGFAVF